MPEQYLVISSGVTKKQAKEEGPGRTVDKHIEGLGLDLDKEEAINTLCSIAGKAQGKGAKALGDLMQAWDNWERVATKIGRKLEVTDRKIEALAALCAWGQGNRQGNK